MIQDLLPEVQVAVVQKFGTTLLSDKSYRSIMRRTLHFIEWLTRQQGFNRLILHSCHLRQVYCDPKPAQFLGDNWDLDETRMPKGLPWRCKTWTSKEGLQIPLREYRLDDMFEPWFLEKHISREVLQRAYSGKSLQRNWMVGRHRIANFIGQVFLDKVVERALLGELFEYGDIRIGVRPVPRDPERLAKAKTSKQHFFHSKGKRYALVLETGQEHPYHLRMTGRMRYQLFHLIKNEGVRYER